MVLLILVGYGIVWEHPYVALLGVDISEFCTKEIFGCLHTSDACVASS